MQLGWRSRLLHIRHMGRGVSMTGTKTVCHPRVIEDIVCVELLTPVLIDEPLIQELETVVIKAIGTQPVPKVIVDFSNVNYVSSAVFGKLIAIHRRLKGSGQRLRLAGMSTLIRQMFAVTRMDSLFDVHDDADAAVRSFADERG